MEKEGVDKRWTGGTKGQMEGKGRKVGERIG